MATHAITLPTRILAGVTVPTSPLIASALSYAQERLNPIAYNHIVRSWLFGVLMIPRIPSLQTLDLDMELHALAAILHDMGWDQTGELVSKDKRFEVDGANAARDFVRKHQNSKDTVADLWKGDEHRIQRLWDAVALHTTLSIAWHKEPEVAGTSFGILMDFTGPDNFPLGPGLVTKEEWENVSREFPRKGLRDGVKEAMCRLCVEKPETTFDNFARDFGEKYVEGYSVEGRRAVDIISASVE